ncbi:MAG: replication initiation protein [Bacteroidota bacterium]
MEIKYLNQSNFFTRSVFNLKKEIHKDIVYLIQSKINFFGPTQDSITVSYGDYISMKKTKRNDTYSFSEFSNFVGEIKHVGGAFYNKINNRFISFNIVDNVQVDKENAETLIIDLAKFGKIFFFKESLLAYIKEITPMGKELKYSGHTQIEQNAVNLKGKRRKKFFEIISQFKNTGFCRIAFSELKMYLGYVEVIDKETQQPISADEQLRLIFLPEDRYEFKDTAPRYSIFERDFLLPAIKNINQDQSKDIKNLMISNKIKSGRRVTHLDFTFNALGAELTEDELTTLEHFVNFGLDESQVKYLLKRIGYKEMYGRYMHSVEKKVYDEGGTPKYYERESKKEISNMSGYLYTVLFPELAK